MTKTKNDVVDEVADILASFGSIVKGFSGKDTLPSYEYFKNKLDIANELLKATKAQLNAHYYKVVCGCLPKEIHTVTMPATYKGWNKAIQEAKQSIAKALGVGKDGG